MLTSFLTLWHDPSFATSVPVLFALGGFASVMMLLWGLAAAAPLLIHLWSRRRVQFTEWAAVQFLLAAVRQSARRLRIERFLLLFLRMAVLILFAMAMADPFLDRGSLLGDAAPNLQPRHVVLVLDGSYSMDAPGRGEATRWETARQAAVKLIEEGRTGDRYSLVLLADPPRAIVGAPSPDVASVRTEIESLLMPQGGGNLAGTLSLLEGLLSDARKDTRRPTQVFFLTDLESTTWSPVETAEVRKLLERLGEEATLSVVQCGQPAGANLAVTSLAHEGGYAAVGRPVSITATVRNESLQRASGRVLRLLVDGKEVDEERVGVPAGGESTISFPYRFATPGEHVVEVVLEDDALPLDNHRWLSLPVRDAVRVLCVSGKYRATYFLRRALAPEADSRWAIQTRTVPETALLDTPLTDYDVVFLANVGRFTEAEAGHLSRYVEQGGHVVFFLGDTAQPANYNERLGSENTPLLPARVLGPAEAGEYRFAPGRYEHALIAPFRGNEDAGLLTVPTWRYQRLEAAEDTMVALRFSDGDPAIVGQPFGFGTVLLVATDCGLSSQDTSQDPPTPWTALPLSPSFVPLVQGMVDLAVMASQAKRNVLVGEPLAGALPGAGGGQVQLEIEITEAAEKSLIGPLGSMVVAGDGAERGWSYSGDNYSGVYAVQREGTAEGESRQLYAVNLDTSLGESALVTIAVEALPAPLKTAGDMSETDALPIAASESAPLFRLLLAAVLLLMLLETLLARRFGAAYA